MKRTLGMFGMLAALTLISTGLPVEARIVRNRLSSNKLAGNKLATNRLSANRLAGNRVVYNRLAANSAALAGGSVSRITSIELPDGTRLQR